MTPRIGLMPMFLGEAAAPARPVAGVMADAPIGVCSPFPMGTMAVDADPALSCRDFAALGFRALEALDGAESVGSAARSEGPLRTRRSRACPSCARWPHPCARRPWRGCSSAKCLQGRPSFWPRGGFPRSVHFVNPPPMEAVGRRPQRGSPTKGADFFARWVRQAHGSAPLGDGVCRARFGCSSATPRLTPRLLTYK